MTRIDELSQRHMHSEQMFLSKALKSAQEAMDSRTEKLQKHLTKTLPDSQEIESQTEIQQKTIDSMVAKFKQHVSMDNALIAAFKEFLGDKIRAADKKQEECLADATKLNNANRDRIDSIDNALEHEIKVRNNINVVLIL